MKHEVAASPHNIDDIGLFVSLESSGLGTDVLRLVDLSLYLS